MCLALTVSAGWKFGAEQSVDVVGGLYPLEAYVGWGFDAPYVDMSALSIAGDLVVTRADLWPWGALSGVTDFDAELVFSYLDDADVILSTNAEFDVSPLPTGIDLLAWDGGVEVVGHVTEVLDINAGVELAYRLGPKDFTTTFFFGFDAEW